MKVKKIKHYFWIVVLLILITSVTVAVKLDFKDNRSSFAEDFKCLNCHKRKDSLERYVQEGRIKSAEDLRSLVRKGPKAGLHITSSDEDLEKAIKYLNIK